MFAIVVEWKFQKVVCMNATRHCVQEGIAIQFPGLAHGKFAKIALTELKLPCKGRLMQFPRQRMTHQMTCMLVVMGLKYDGGSR